MKPFFPCAGTRALHAPTRREFIYSLGASLGSVAFTAMMAREARGADNPQSAIRNRLARSRRKPGIFPRRRRAAFS